MKINEKQSDQVILAEIGQRVARRRIDRQLTQAELAREAGVGKRTVERFENGESSQLITLIRIFRVLDLLPNLDAMVPEPGISPLDLVALKGKTRKRVSKRRKEVAEGDWQWKDKQ